MEELAEQLKKQILSYASDAIVLSESKEFETNVNLEGFVQVKPIEQEILTNKQNYYEMEKLRKSIPMEPYKSDYWHWSIRKEDDDLDYAMSMATEEIGLMRFLGPIKKLYWKHEPTIECSKDSDNEDIYSICTRFSLGF